MLTFEQMKELLELVASKGLGGVEVRGADFHFRVSGSEPLSSVSGEPAVVSAAPSTESSSTEGSSAVASGLPTEQAEPEGYILTSPIVGTFYSAPSPDTDAYVNPGDRVEKGQVLCIVEAMKLMNEIESDVSGVILEVFPQNGQPVEFGEPLFAIKTD